MKLRRFKCVLVSMNTPNMPEAFSPGYSKAAGWRLHNRAERYSLPVGMGKAAPSSKFLLDVLLVDDCEDDIALFDKAAERAKVSLRTRAAGGVEEAIRYLLGDGIYRNRSRHPFPDLVVLDWNMPGKTGSQFLTWRKRHAAFAHLPVLIVSGQVDPRAAEKALALGALGYLAKPPTLNQWVELVRQVWDLGIHYSSALRSEGPPSRREGERPREP